MSITDATIETPPTSTADTRQTEPEVIAGISSGSGDPNLPLSFRQDGDRRFGTGTILLLLAGGAALGYGMMRWLRA